MATLTSTPSISPSSLSISGTTTATATISWVCPTVPAGTTVPSCVLSGKATASMTKGSVTIKVNGTTVTSGSTFSINLGMSNTTSSVGVTAVGGNKNANGTVTFSNLSYTVTYFQTYTVTFVDWDGTVLKTQQVTSGNAATAPSNPTRSGYEFIGWDKSFSNVTSNLTVTAQYTEVSVSPLKVKENNIWRPINKIYQKINANWIQCESVENIFNTEQHYIRNILPTAILYEDGTLVFSNDESIENNHGIIIKKYVGWMKYLGNANLIPWHNERNEIKYVYFKNEIAPTGIEYWFYNCTNMVSIDFNNLNEENIESMKSTFENCSNITSLNFNNFNAPKSGNWSFMFYGCSGLSSLDLSSFSSYNQYGSLTYMFGNCSNLMTLDFSNYTIISDYIDIDNMFYNCNNLTTVYVDSEYEATRFKEAVGTPSTVNFIVK